VSAAFSSALNYFVAGSGLLEDNPWQSQHELAFSLELHRAECEFLTGRSATAEKRLNVLSTRCANTLELAAVSCLLIDLYTTCDQAEKAIASCLDYLQRLGVEWSPRPRKEEVQQEYKRIWTQIGNRTIEQFIDLPLGTDPEFLATLDVLTKVVPAAMFSDENFGSMAICRAVNLSLERGNSDGSS